MSFTLRKQSPLRQVKNPAKFPNFNYPSGKFNDKITSKQSLNSKGESETKYYRGDYEVSPKESNTLRNKDMQKATHKRQDYNRAQPNATTQSLYDISGVSQWGEAKLAAKELLKMTNLKNL